jgi:hypothetical protein
MSGIAGEIIIARPVDVDFDYVADQSNDAVQPAHGAGGEDHPTVSGRNGPYGLAVGAGPVAVADVRVLVAVAADAWALRRRFKE